MNPSDQQHTISLQFTPQTNPNPYFINSFPSQNTNFNSVPRKPRRAGRRPNATLFGSGQVYTSPLVNSQNVNINLSDEIIVINKDSTAEAVTALTSGFPADVLTDEEIDAGVVSVVGGIEQVNYIIIRNHIITKWRENVSTWLTKEMFVNVVPLHCGKLLDSAYEYLVSHGYVNFGVAKEIKEKIPSEMTKSNVIIVGAGLAGLAAARQLMRFGFKVTVLEGRKRAGGRVYTRKVEGGNKTAAADLGGSVLTGTLGNPLGILARQLSSSLHKVRDKCPLYRLDGNPVDLDMDLKVENAFNRLLDRASRLRQLMGEVSQDVSLGSALETFRQDYGDAVNAEELNLFNWHLANLEYANAGLLSKLSLAFWDQDDPYDMGGDHCFLPGGNGRFVQALTENVPILYEKTVNTVRYSGNGVQVVAGTQVFEGDMVLCTVPLGVLKSGSIKFIPELPQRKLDGIKRLGFGLLNKVAMLFPDVFWGTDLDMFGHLTDDPSRRGEFFLFYSYATVAGGALLIALVAGEAAHTFESMPPTDAVTRVLQILRDIYEPQGITVPEPIQTVCTRWGSDPFSLGSYSNVAVGASGDDYDILAENVGDGRVFFAGEATNRRYPATMHGAFLSGLREAAHMARYANNRALRKRVDKRPARNPHIQASLLADLFREPDIEFGSYAIIYDKKNTDPKSLAVLRVTFSGPRKENNETNQQHSNKLLFQQLQSHFNQKQEFHIYTLLPRQQALELWEVRGGDDMRLKFLTEKLGVKLVGRKGLGPMADSIISSIKAERGTRKSTPTSLALKSGLSKPKPATSKQKLVRRAKIMRSKNGAGSSLIASGAKPVGMDVNLDGSTSGVCISQAAGGAKLLGCTDVVPLSSLNQNVGDQMLIDDNLNGGNNVASVSHIVAGVKALGSGVVPSSSFNRDIEDQVLTDDHLNGGASILQIAGGAKPVDTSAVPFTLLNQNAGAINLNDGYLNRDNNGYGNLHIAEFSKLLSTVPVPVSLLSQNLGGGGMVIADGNLSDCKNGTSNLETDAKPVGDVLTITSENQNSGSLIPTEGIFNSETYSPTIDGGDIFAGNSGSSTVPIDIPLEFVHVSVSLPGSYLVDSQMGEQPSGGANFSNSD